MGGSLADQPVEQSPAVEPAVVGGGLRVVALARGGRGHLGRARADQIESHAGHRHESVAQSHVYAVGHAVAGGIVTRACHGFGTDIRGDDMRARAGREHRGEAGARTDLEHSLAAPHAQMAAEEQRAGLGRLSPRGNPERAVAIVEEQDAVEVVAHASGQPVTRAYTSR